MKRIAACLPFLCLLFSTAVAADSLALTTAPGPGQGFRHCDDCPDMVVIPAGSFEMGRPTSKAARNGDKAPRHRISIRSFAIGKTEVTQGQWKAVMGSNPSKFSKCGDDCPVENVNWDSAQDFIRRLNAKTGQTYRLPSEAEWEYACRAGSAHTYCGGENIDRLAWYESNSGKKTHPVAKKQPNAWGLYDMSGNVWEWTQDCHDENYLGAPLDGTAGNAGDCGRGMLRGGSWSGLQRLARAAYRSGYPAKSRAYNVVSGSKDFGLRLAATLP